MKSIGYQSFKHTGIVTDLPPEEVPPGNWTGGGNIQFQDTSTRRVGGYKSMVTPSAAPQFSVNVVVGPVSYWVYCGATTVHVTDGVANWNITPTGLSATQVGEWSCGILNGIPSFSNGINPPFYWDLVTANICKTLPGWPAGASCRVIRAFKFHLMAINVFDGTGQLGSTVWWSASAVPGAVPTEWTPTAENDAGDIDLADTPGALVDGLALRDLFVVYKDNATYALSYVAGQYTYTSRKLFLTSGLSSSNCVVEINGEHWVFTGSDVIRHDGQNFSSVVQDKTKHGIVDAIDPTKVTWSCVAANSRTQQLWICVATQGSPYLNKAWVINTLTGDAGERDLPLVAHVARGLVDANPPDLQWDTDSQDWDQDVTFWDQQAYSPNNDSFVMADVDSVQLWAVDQADTANGQPISAYCERLSLPINDNILRALVTAVVPRLEGEPGEVISIRVGGQAFFSQPITWSDPLPFVIGVDVAVQCLVEGRLISVRFEGKTARQWRIYSYKLAVVDLGLY